MGAEPLREKAVEIKYLNTAKSRRFTAISRRADFCSSSDELGVYRGSKYVQSRNDIYNEIKQKLQSNIKLLFVGTGCQVAALRSYLGHEYENLVCVDLVCHGAPSPGIWEDYLTYLCNLHGENRANNVNFRSKQISWRVYSLEVQFDSGKKYVKSKFRDPYLIAFTKDYISRSCCEHCRYANLNRTGDITISDFWGYQSVNFNFRNDNKGISCCIINTDKGEKLFDSLDVIKTEQNVEAAIRGNRSLIKPWKRNDESDEFWRRYKQEGIVAMLDICKPFDFPLKMKLDWFIQDHLYMLPYSFIKKKRGKFFNRK